MLKPDIIPMLAKNSFAGSFFGGDKREQRINDVKLYIESFSRYIN
jgi:hypothetical protein